MLGKTVEELGRSMSSTELSEWLAFESAYGLPDVYFQTAILASTLECLWSEKPRKPSDVIPFFRDDAVGQSPAEMLGRLQAIAARQTRQ